jgi:hypothetical protein
VEAAQEAAKGDGASADSDTTATATTTAEKIEGDVWVTGQRLVAVGKDGWWQQFSLSLSECWFFKSRFETVQIETWLSENGGNI